MSEIEFPPDLIDLQRALHAAWEAVEAHRKAVDSERRAGVPVESDPTRRWESPQLRPWADAEDAEHARLMAVVRETAEQLRAGILSFQAKNPGHLRYDVTQQLHKAARA